MQCDCINDARSIAKTSTKIKVHATRVTAKTDVKPDLLSIVRSTRR